MHARPDKQITRVGALPQLLADNRPAQLTIELTIFQRSTPHLLAHDPVLLQERLHGTPKHPLQLPERPRGQLRCGRAHWGLRPVPPCSRPHTLSTPWWLPARPFPSSIFLDKNRSDIGKSQSIRTDSKMETAGSLLSCHEQLLQLTLITKHRAPLRCDPSSSPQAPPQRSHPTHATAPHMGYCASSEDTVQPTITAPTPSAMHASQPAAHLPADCGDRSAARTAARWLSRWRRSPEQAPAGLQPRAGASAEPPV
jgi:hypothetical protein